MKPWAERPIVFDDNRITRPYIGGKLLNEWRGMPKSEDGHQCEELLVTSIGAISKGKENGFAISKTIPALGGISLSELLKEEPTQILGKAFQEENPFHLSVLARAGDTIVRLVLQCHPKAEDARRYFHSPIGKSEAWYIVRTREIENEETCVYAGFKQFVTPELWKSLCEQQKIEEMVHCLHKIPVSKGDVILIPAGMPHAVGPGCLFLEIHECSDITIRAERCINGITLSDEEIFHGLSMEQGLQLFDYTTYREEEIRKQIIMNPKDQLQQNKSRQVTMISKEDSDAFGMQIITLRDSYMLPDFEGHRILVPVEGDILIEYGKERDHQIVKQGCGVLLPAQCKDIRIKALEAVVVVGLPVEKEKEERR